MNWVFAYGSFVGRLLVLFEVRELLLVVRIGAHEVGLHVIDAALRIHKELVRLAFDLDLLHHNSINHVDRFSFFIVLAFVLLVVFLVSGHLIELGPVQLLADIQLLLAETIIKLTFVVHLVSKHLLVSLNRLLHMVVVLLDRSRLGAPRCSLFQKDRVRHRYVTRAMAALQWRQILLLDFWLGKGGKLWRRTALILIRVVWRVDVRLPPGLETLIVVDDTTFFNSLAELVIRFGFFGGLLIVNEAFPLKEVLLATFLTFVLGHVVGGVDLIGVVLDVDLLILLIYCDVLLQSVDETD